MDMPEYVNFFAENRWIFIVLWLVTMVPLSIMATFLYRPTKYTGTTVRFALSKGKKAIISCASKRARVKANSVNPFCISVEGSVVQESTEFSKWANIFNEEIPIGTLTVDKPGVYIEMTADHEICAEVHSNTLVDVLLYAAILFITYAITRVCLEGYYF